eukprot:XP_003725443.1 PREDICTED: tRNA (adenine(58)-N(1))-methyltransferase catalytic subunit TRMT61A isoform X1 [Strongylocentrotus purpuratus]
MSFLGYEERVRPNDKVIIFLGHDSMMPLKMVMGSTSQTKYGALRHSEIIGKRYGSKLSTVGGKGWVYVLHPTPELWTVNLPHRTQVLYFPDISLLTIELELKPGSIVVEAGTGSGSVSHALTRTIAPDGHLYTFEFHEKRAQLAADEFKEHGLSHIVTATHRDVSQDGFQLENDYVADAVFLDLPSPWNVVPHAKKVLKSSGGRICSFSPCIEQVQRVCLELDQLGFSDIKTVECLMRTHEVRTVNLTLPNLGQPCLTPNITDHKAEEDTFELTDGGARLVDLGANYSFEEPGSQSSTGDCSYPKKCALAPRETPGHTGYLTFASLYSYHE